MAFTTDGVIMDCRVARFELSEFNDAPRSAQAQ